MSAERSSSIWVERTRSEWRDFIESFLTTYVPKWFSLIESVFLLGGLRYVHNRSQNPAVKWLYDITFFLFFFYLFALLRQIPFNRLLPPSLSGRTWLHRTMSLAMAGVVWYIVYCALSEVLPLTAPR